MQRVVTLHIMAGVAGESRFWDPLKSEYPKEASLETADRQSVLRQAEENNVQFIRLWFTDVLGTLKSFAITVEELEDALDGGMGFDGSSITGYQDIEELDMIAMPVPETFKIIPWSPQESRTARMICNVQTPDGDPYVGDPRYVLRRALERANEMGFDNFYCGPELEYFYFKNSASPEPLDYGGPVLPPPPDAPT